MAKEKREIGKRDTDDAFLDLTADAEESRARPTVKLPDGRTVRMLTPDDLTLGELQRIVSLQDKDASDVDVRQMLAAILPDATSDEIDALRTIHARRIVDFFLRWSPGLKGEPPGRGRQSKRS